MSKLRTHVGLCVLVLFGSHLHARVAPVTLSAGKYTASRTVLTTGYGPKLNTLVTGVGFGSRASRDNSTFRNGRHGYPRVSLERLDVDNYATRADALHTHREGLVAARHDGEVTDKAGDQKALALIGLSVMDHHLPSLGQRETAKAAWDALEAVYKAKSMARRVALKREMNSLKKAADEPMGQVRGARQGPAGPAGWPPVWSPRTRRSRRLCWRGCRRTTTSSWRCWRPPPARWIWTCCSASCSRRSSACLRPTCQRSPGPTLGRRSVHLAAAGRGLRRAASIARSSAT